MGKYFGRQPRYSQQEAEAQAKQALDALVAKGRPPENEFSKVRGRMGDLPPRPPVDIPQPPPRRADAVGPRRPLSEILRPQAEPVVEPPAPEPEPDPVPAPPVRARRTLAAEPAPAPVKRATRAKAAEAAPTKGATKAAAPAPRVTKAAPAKRAAKATVEAPAPAKRAPRATKAAAPAPPAKRAAASPPAKRPAAKKRTG